MDLNEFSVQMAASSVLLEIAISSIASGDTNKAMRFINLMTEINAPRVRTGQTAIDFAIYYGRTSIVQNLLNRNADISTLREGTGNETYTVDWHIDNSPKLSDGAKEQMRAIIQQGRQNNANRLNNI